MQKVLLSCTPSKWDSTSGLPSSPLSAAYLITGAAHEVLPSPPIQTSQNNSKKRELTCLTLTSIHLLMIPVNAFQQNISSKHSLILHICPSEDILCSPAEVTHMFIHKSLRLWNYFCLLLCSPTIEHLQQSSPLSPINKNPFHRGSPLYIITSSTWVQGCYNYCQLCKQESLVWLLEEELALKCKILVAICPFERANRRVNGLMEGTASEYQWCK